MITDYPRVENNTKAIEEYLKKKSVKEVYEVEHKGNFIFEAKTSLGTIKVVTEPVNEEQTRIRIISAKII